MSSQEIFNNAISKRDGYKWNTECRIIIIVVVMHLMFMIHLNHKNKEDELEKNTFDGRTTTKIRLNETKNILWCEF